MPALNYAQLYEQALQQRFTVGLRFNALYATPNNARYKWADAKTILIPSILVSGMQDVDRDNISAFGRNVDNKFTAKTLSHDREFPTLVDPMDIDETNLALTISNITQVFNDEKKIPEMDKFMASKLYSEVTNFNGVIDNTAITTANALKLFDSLMNDMDEAEVPEEGRILYVTNTIYKTLKEAEDLVRFMTVQNNNGQVNRAVRSLDEVTIVKVPSSRMKSAYVFDNGAEPDDSAVQINMILIHPLAIISPMKYEFVSLEQPSAHSKGKWLYYERSYWDVFAIENKIPGIAINADGGN